VNDKVETIWTEEIVANLRHYSGIFLKELRKTTKNLSQDSRSSGRDLNPGPPKYEAGVFDCSTTAFGEICLKIYTSIAMCLLTFQPTVIKCPVCEVSYFVTLFLFSLLLHAPFCWYFRISVYVYKSSPGFY
jgi:hypothetical protein